MIEIGTLVRKSGDMAIVVDDWYETSSGEYHAVVKWLTGRHVGERRAILNYNWQVIA